jgi:multiple sugar transport system substrate-binding protein
VNQPLSRRRFVASAGGAVAALAARSPALVRAQGSPITLTMWDNNAFADLAKGLDEIMLAYQQATPNVTLKLVHNQNLPKTLTAISAGTGPDVVWLWDGSEPIGTWAETGAIGSLDDAIKASGYDLKQLVPAALNTTTYKGQVYGLPLVADAYWLWWNKAVFSEVGLDPETPPKTIEELWQFADTLTKKDGDRVTRLGMRLPQNMPQYQTWAYAFGADFYDPEAHKLLITSPDMLAAMGDIAGGYAKFGPDTVDRFNASLGQGGTAQDPFLQGKVAMQLDGDWIVQYIRDYKPDWKYPDAFGIAALPWAAGKEKPGGVSNVLRTYPLVLVKNTQHPQEAWDFIRWLQSPEITVKIAKYLINLPQSTAALSDPQLTSVPGFGTILEAFRTSQNIKSLPAMPASAEFADTFEKEITLAFHGKEAVDAALQKVAEKIQPEIDKIAGT